MKTHTHNKLSELFGNIIYTIRKRWSIIIALLFVLFIWYHVAWGEEPLKLDHYGLNIRCHDGKCIQTATGFSTPEGINVFLELHPNCKVIDHLGDLYKIECELRQEVILK